MPKINIYIEDVTGTPYQGNEIVVLVPGNCTVKTGKADKNGLVLIPSNAAVDTYLEKPTETDPSIATYVYVSELVARGFYVLYKSGIETLSQIADFYSETYLKDKNEYRVRYLTSGALNSIDVDVSTSSNIYYAAAQNMIDLAKELQNAVALIDFKTKGTTTVSDLVGYINDPGTITDTLGYGAMFADGGKYKNIDMPGSFFYLMKAGDAFENNQRWDSIAGIKRGVLGDLYDGPSNMHISKYDIDNTVQKDSDKSFNGIVYIRPYGYTIWGDRTLRENTAGEGLKATSFLSLRLLVCDICDRVYQASIDNTFESNNDVTWMAYKTSITDLLDQMVADGKLADYEMTKLVSDKASQIKCRIRLVPNEPVEDFDIYIRLENNESGEATVEIE